MSKKMQSNIMLLTAAIIWGLAFVAQKAGTVLEPFTYNGVRLLIGGLVLIPVIMLLNKKEANSGAAITQAETKAADNSIYDTQKNRGRTVLTGGICCGLILCVATNLQQFGIYFATDAGKAGFITSLYIIFVPVLGIFLKKRVKPLVWGCVLLGAVGFYLLTMAGSHTALQLQQGDFYVLLCSFVFALHIMAIDYFSPKCDGLKLSCLQFLVAGVICLVLMLLFETPILADIVACWLPILYCGIFSSGVGYTLQILGQKHAEPTTATLLMSLESVFAVIFGILIAGEQITLLEGLGCIVIFTAVIIPQLGSNERGDLKNGINQNNAR